MRRSHPDRGASPPDCNSVRMASIVLRAGIAGGQDAGYQFTYFLGPRERAGPSRSTLRSARGWPDFLPAAGIRWSPAHAPERSPWPRSSGCNRQLLCAAESRRWVGHDRTLRRRIRRGTSASRVSSDAGRRSQLRDDVRRDLTSEPTPSRRMIFVIHAAGARADARGVMRAVRDLRRLARLATRRVPRVADGERHGANRTRPELATPLDPLEQDDRKSASESAAAQQARTGRE